MTKPFVISRVFDAPRDRVWRAWTEVKTFDQGRDSMKGGWTGTLDQFSACLAKG